MGVKSCFRPGQRVVQAKVRRLRSHGPNPQTGVTGALQRMIIRQPAGRGVGFANRKGDVQPACELARNQDAANANAVRHGATMREAGPYVKAGVLSA